MEKNMENDMEAGLYWDIMGYRVLRFMYGYWCTVLGFRDLGLEVQFARLSVPPFAGVANSSPPSQNLACQTNISYRGEKWH